MVVESSAVRAGAMHGGMLRSSTRGRCMWMCTPCCCFRPKTGSEACCSAALLTTALLRFPSACAEMNRLEGLRRCSCTTILSRPTPQQGQPRLRSTLNRPSGA